MEIRKLTSKRFLKTILAVVVIILLLLYFVGPGVCTEIGRRYLEQRQHALAKPWLVLATWLPSSDAAAHFQLARLLRREGETEAATQELAAAQRLGLSDATYDRELQLLEVQSRKYPSSVDAWRSLVRGAGSDLPEVCEAFVLFRLSRFENQQAIELLRAWQKEYPKDAKCYQLLGTVDVLGEKWKTAIEHYRRASELTDDNAEILISLAQAQMALLQYADAEVSLTRVVEKNPDLPKAQLLLAQCLMRLHKTTEAKQILMKEQARYGESPELHGYLGELAYLEEDYESARQHLQLAVADRPFDRERRYLYAMSLQQTGRAAEAQAEFAFVREATDALQRQSILTAQLARSPNDVDLRFELAQLTWKYQSRENGLRWFMELLALDPNHRPTHRFLAQEYRSLGDEERARFHQSKVDANP